MPLDLTQISTAELEAALAARQAAATSRAQAHEQATWRTHTDEVQARKEANQTKWGGQSAYDWGRHFAAAGMPVAAAQIFAECVAVIFKRLTALENAERIEALERRIKALEQNQQPAHMQGVQRR